MTAHHLRKVLLLLSEVANGFEHMLTHLQPAFEPASCTQANPDVGAVGDLDGSSVPLEAAKKATGDAPQRVDRRIVWMDADIDLSLFGYRDQLYLAGGDVAKCVTYAANFGRDADTIGAMCGAMAGALQGVDGIKVEWAQKVGQYASLNQEALAADLVNVALGKCEAEREAWRAPKSISA